MGWVFTDEMRFYLHEGESILDGMIRTHHHDVRYECRQGYCGSCRMRVKASTGVLHHTLPPLAHLDDGEILACCCVAMGTLAVTYLTSQGESNQPLLFAELKDELPVAVAQLDNETIFD